MCCSYLTGNPCTEYPGYREFVIATLPQLKVKIDFLFLHVKLLDGVEITKSERIIALQNLERIRPIIEEKQREHGLKRVSGWWIFMINWLWISILLI